MGVFDVEQLLAPISPDRPCGDDLEYDAEFGEMERAAQPVAEQQFGDTVIEGQEPDWKEVRRKALSLLSRTKDVRVAVMLARAGVRTDDVAGFSDAIAVVRGLVERYWEGLHPQLDPDDDNDPTLRVNSLASLFDEDACLRALSEAPLVASAALGRFSYRDYRVATGELAPTGEQPAVEMSTLEAACMDADLDDLQQRAALVRRAIEDVQALEVTLTQQVGVAHAADFSPLVDLLTKMSRVLTEQLQRRGVTEAPDETAAEDAVAEGTDGQPAVAQPVALDKVSSRQDVIRLLDKICDYYREHEPSSPVPLLLLRAKRVASMGFLELLRELAPGGMQEAKAAAGASEEGVDD